MENSFCFFFWIFINKIKKRVVVIFCVFVSEFWFPFRESMHGIHNLMLLKLKITLKGSTLFLNLNSVSFCILSSWKHAKITNNGLLSLWKLLSLWLHHSFLIIGNKSKTTDVEVYIYKYIDKFNQCYTASRSIAMVLFKLT